MPIVTVQMLEGRTVEQKQALIKEVTETVVKTTGAKQEAVTVVIEEMKKENYGVAGVSPK
ncbi:4-oxalocrotonate tautomerase family protein [Vagococcus lutrae]|uniref:2-hydroxymuconate tautomerase n=1 Tax=Vagococcus TaxID=2737 RepID=UPI000ECC0B6A|nr:MULTISPECIES: 2-hydroxymuconate tautomerase [Vagococcus]MDO5741699.1 2-hydroxymuconate tautomerase [Vagococcus sp.]MDT2801103.1 4-oxalocrotonate tautomerase family protein [Vagococcus lutrae]MDT2805526.1 4-oxalocrotonate tautomerase family protein [Vagococcus lutrae]MDT2808622.1 4-oxalocrotonate tautomerase family protein [Vagococcus lutrae]MDT2812330.1 4-oxalocrotonate tautomerase family protein [Vagococcus lutrae]